MDRSPQSPELCDILNDHPQKTAAAREAMADSLGQARCPVCQHPMVARLGRRGPYFQCGCEKYSRAS